MKSENKRYTVKSQDDFFAVVDNYFEDKRCIINGILTEIEAGWLCDEMNDLNNENEQLKNKNLELKKGLDNDLELIISLQDENNQLKELSDCEKLQKVLIEHKERLLDCKRHDEPTEYWSGALDCIDNISEILGVDLE